jgi:hypothetical protein
MNRQDSEDSGLTTCIGETYSLLAAGRTYNWVVMRQPPEPGNRELQDLIWGAYKQVQRLRSQWPPAESRETLPALGTADQRSAAARLVERTQERLRSIQGDLETLQRVVEEERQAAEASRPGARPALSIGSTAELFEAVRLGIVDVAEARQLLRLAAKEESAGTAKAEPDQPPLVTEDPAQG